MILSLAFIYEGFALFVYTIGKMLSAKIAISKPILVNLRILL